MTISQRKGDVPGLLLFCHLLFESGSIPVCAVPEVFDHSLMLIVATPKLDLHKVFQRKLRVSGRTRLSQKSPQDSHPAASCGQSASDVEKARLAASGSPSAR